MLRIKFDYKKLNPNATSVLNEYEIEQSYYFSTEPLDYDGRYWEARITDSFEIERFFDITADTSNRIRTLSVSLDNSDKFFNQFVENGKSLLNNQMTLYYSDGVSASKNFTGTIQEIESFSSVVRLRLREIGYEYLEEKFPDAQVAYDYYSDNGINDSWNAIPIHFGRVDDYPVSWVNSFYSEFMVGSGPILRITKIYIDKDHEDGDEYGVDDGVVYYVDSNNTPHETNYKPKKTDGDDQIIHVRIFRGEGWDADGKREIITDTHRPENVDTSRWTNDTTAGRYKHISQWGGFAYIQFYRLEINDVNGTPTEYEVPAYPLNHDGSIGQVYVCLEGIVSVTKSGNNYTYGSTPPTYQYYDPDLHENITTGVPVNGFACKMITDGSLVRNPASIIKMMFCNDEFVSEGPCAIGWGYKESVCDFAQAIIDCDDPNNYDDDNKTHLNLKVDGTFNESQPFSEALKQILYVCRGAVSEENGIITLSIDKRRTRTENNKQVLDVKTTFDEEGEVGADCILEEWHEPQLDEQYNRIRLSYDYNEKKQRLVKKPDANHESPDYDSTNPSGTSQYDTWLHDTESYYQLKKWNTTEMELRLVKDTMTAHKLASYYLRKALYQKITGTITVANKSSENLDAGMLIRIRSKQFGWYRTYTDGTSTDIDTDDGKLFQITSIKKGEENTTIDFIEYDDRVFLLDEQSSMTTKNIPSAVFASLMPKAPNSISVEKEIVNGSNGTNLVYAKVTLTYKSGTNMINALIQYADMGTTQPSSAPSDSDTSHPWIDFDTIGGTVSKKSVTPGHYYYFRACTVNVNGSSSFKTSSYIKMDGDTTAPSAPTIEAEQINGRNILLKLSLNSAPSDFKGFKLYKDDTYITSIIADTGSNGNAVCEHTDVCEHYRTTYVYKAKSYDIWGNESAYSQAINVRTPDDIDLENISETIQLLNQDIIDTNTRIDGYISDDVLSIGEKARLAEDWIAIRDSRYNKVKTEAENHYFNSAISVYNQDYLDFVDAYEALEAYVDGNGSPIKLTPTPPAVLEESRIEGVGSTIKKKFSDYYELEIKVLSDIDKDNNNRASTIYAECHTEANVASKWVILPNVVIFKGLRLSVKFFNGNTSPGLITLNIKRNVSDESGLITGGKLYDNSGLAIPVITFEAGTTITLVLTEKTETIEGIDTTVHAWEFSDSSILGLGERELAFGNKTFSLGMVNGNRIIAETVDTQQLTAQAVTSEKITSEQIIGKDFGTAENVGEIDDETHEHISGVRFNANGIKAYNASGETVSIGINGDITAISGFIGGWKINSTSISSTPTSSSMPSIVLNANGMIYSSNYVNGVGGWKIDSIGNAELNSARIRGKIQSVVFEFDKVSAIGGNMMVKPASVIFADSTHVNTSTTVYVKDSDSFAVGDCFYIKKDIEHMFYGIISAISTQTLSDGTVISVITYSIPSEGGTFFEPDDGQSIVNYGNPMSGGIMFDGRDGYIDIFKNHTGSLERDYNIYDPILNINAWDSTTASIAEEDGVVDISGEDNHGQAYGDVSVVNDKVMGRCFYFDRSDSTDLGCLSFINHANLFYGMTKISLTFTFKATSLEPVASNTYAVPFLIHSNTGAENTLFGSFIIWSDGHFATRLSLHTTTNPPEFTGSIGTFETNKEYCLILTSDFTINKTVVYLNGVKIGECQSGIGTIENTITTFNFGSHFSDANYKNYRFKGLIKDFRIFDKVLTPEEVQVIYKQSLVTPYINSNMYEPILNLDADYSTTASIAEEDGVIDVSGNHNNGTAYGGVTVVDDELMGKCFGFDGTNDYIELKELNTENTAITISVNVYFNGFQENYNRLVDKRKSNNEWSFLYYPPTSSIDERKSSITFESWNTNGVLTTYITDQNIDLELNTWHNIAVTVDNNSKILNIYLDGNLQKSHSFTDIKKINYINTNLVRIGTYALASGQFLNGLISDVRIYPRALTASEVYNVYQQSLNPEAFENPEKLISYDEINVHHFSGDAIQLDHLVRLGNLKGIADITDDRYGIFLGDERSYLKYDSVDGLKLINSNFALDGSILSDNFLWIDGNGNAHDDIDMEIASDTVKGITSGQRYTKIGSMINMTTGAIVTPTFRTMSAIGNNPAETHITGNMYFDNDTSGVIEPTTDNIITFGSSSKRWKYIYSKDGDFSGSVTATGGFVGNLAGTASNATAVSMKHTNSSTTWHKVPFLNGSTDGESCYPCVETDSFLFYPGSSPAAGTEGLCILQLGNAKANATAGNKTGYIRFYGNGTKYTQIHAGSPSSDITVNLPTSTGTLARTADVYDDSGDFRMLYGKGGTSNTWVRTTSQGIIPSQSGASGSGHCSLGTSSWYFSTAYIDNIYGKLNGNCTGSSGSCTGNAATATSATSATTATNANTVNGSYTGSGGQKNPNYFGKNKVGFLMMNTTVNGNSNYKDWIIMDCYSGSDVGGGVAFGVNRQSLGAYIMRSAAARTSWAESAELIGTHNYTSYTVKKDGTGASGSWGISITGSSASCTGNAASATYATNIRVTNTNSNTWYPLVFSSGSSASTNYAARVSSDSILFYPGTSPAANNQGYCYLLLGNTTHLNTAGNKRGVLRIAGIYNFFTQIMSSATNTDSTIYLPNKSGTFALTSDIPSESSKNPCSYASSSNNYAYVYYDRIASDGKTWRFLFINIPVAKYNTNPPGYTFTIPSPYALDWQTAQVIAVCASNSTSHYPRTTEGSPRAGFKSSSSLFISPGSNTYTSGVNIMAVYQIV